MAGHAPRALLQGRKAFVAVIAMGHPKAYGCASGRCERGVDRVITCVEPRTREHG
jgi:hypothetical protein